MKVCIIAPYPGFPGGQIIQALEIIRGFKKEGLKVHFLPVNPPLNGAWGWFQRVKYFRTLVNTVAYFFRLFRSIKNFDILHVFSASYFSFLLAPTPAVLIGRFFGKKVILNYHSGEAEDHLKRSFRIVNKVFKKVDALVVPSLYLKKIFEQFGFQAEVIFNVVDLGTFAFKKRENFKPRFLVNRSLEPMYNVGCVLKAFKIVQDSYPEAELFVIGSGSEEKNLRKLSKELDLKNVFFTGVIEHEKIPDYLSKADFLLNASNIDNMPISILEAFSCGLPVISTNPGGIPYIIEDDRNGFLVNIDDHEAIAKKAIFLLNNPGVAIRVAWTARQDCEKFYSWEVNRDKWLKLYKVNEKNL